jgi:hypothetical protein
VRSQGHWFDPGSKEFLPVAAIFRREDAASEGLLAYGLGRCLWHSMILTC